MLEVEGHFITFLINTGALHSTFNTTSFTVSLPWNHNILAAKDFCILAHDLPLFQPLNISFFKKMSIFNWRTVVYNIVLVSAIINMNQHIHQRESATDIHMSIPSWTSFPTPTPSHPSRLSQSTGLSSLHHTANSHLLSSGNLLYIRKDIWFHATLSISPTLSFPLTLWDLLTLSTSSFSDILSLEIYKESHHELEYQNSLWSPKDSFYTFPAPPNRYISLIGTHSNLRVF